LKNLRIVFMRSARINVEASPRGGCVHGRILILQQIQRIVSAGTPDLSGRMLNYAGSLPHECGVPPQCPVAPCVHASTMRLSGCPATGRSPEGLPTVRAPGCAVFVVVARRK
jgi:hypothetical protein